MSAIATMKVLIDAEKNRSTREAQQANGTVASVASAAAVSLGRPSPLPEQQSHWLVQLQPSTPSISPPSTLTPSTLTSTSTAMVIPPPVEVGPMVPRLNTTATAMVHYSDSVNSSASSSPTMGSHDAVTFTFSSPLFYDQKLCIYHALLSFYSQLAQYIERRPVILLMLQYSVALIHGFTVYLLSVVLSVAQLIMIAATIENLDWIQSYKPLMCEWDSCFPGFVFPALDIDSEEEDDSPNASKTVSRVRKGGRYWHAQKTLKPGEDPIDDGYHSEESQQQLTARQSMNSTLRKRLAKYQNWMPLLWSPEENSIQEASEETEEEQGQDETADHYSARIRRALVRTLSGGNYKPTKGKRRVTFNEQAMIFGRRRLSQVSQEFSPGADSLSITAASAPSETVKPSTSLAMEAGKQEQVSSTTAIVAREQRNISSAGPMIVSDPSSTSMDKEKLTALTREEAVYQQRTASDDTNGSGTSSPTFLPTSPSDSASIISSTSSVSKSVVANVVKQSPDLRRSSSVPMKIGSFLSRNQSNQGPRSTSPRHSSTFSESSTVSKNPRTLPDHLATPSVTIAAAAPQQDNKQEAGSSPRPSFSLGTRAKRSFSLALPRPNSHNNSTTANAALVTATESNKDASSIDHQGPLGKKNFMYRIVHPQRYRRELEQQLTDQERRRLLTMANLQRDHILAADAFDSSARFTSSEAAAALRGADSVLCGDPYYYATSTEYIEGLGAPNSVISTSIGTSFPEQLQRHGRSSSGSTGRTKVPRPSSYDFDCRPVEVHTGACGYGSEGETTSSRMTGKLEKTIAAGPHHGFFRRDSKKKSEGISQDKPHSPNRLQQLFSHPGHKRSHSSSSSLDVVVNADSTATKDAAVSVPSHGGRTTPPAFSSPTAANAHKLLSRARTNSRQFTSFTALGVPAYPPAQPMIPNLQSAQLPGVVPVHEMDHTSFAAFGFPSPTQSPVHSAPALPRHSTSSVAEFQAHLVRQSIYVATEDFAGQAVESPEEYYYHHQQHHFQERYYHQQQEVLLPEDGIQDHDAIYYLPSSAPTGGVIESAAFGENGQQDDGQFSHTSSTSRSSSRSSQYGQSDQEGTNAPAVVGVVNGVDGAAATKRPKGLSFIRKLSLKKKK